MMGVRELRRLLNERGLTPKKSLGQNFLIDGNLVRKLVASSGVGAGDVVLEVGPGAGALTEELLATGCQVVACEMDRGLAELLRDRFADAGESFSLIEGDCLASKRSINEELVEAIGGHEITLVANLPYSVASPLMMTLLLEHPQCTSLWVTIQAEVAERFAASPGGKEYGELSVVAQTIAEVQPVATVGASCFWPQPKVTSAMIGLVRRSAPRARDPHRLQELCRTLFTKRRKQIGTTLKEEMCDRAWPANVDPRSRPEQLTIAQFVSLLDCME